MDKIKNPILPGFHPDPSILRVGDDYYIATSTFEWFPGVMIYHSKDLKNWHLVATPLNRISQLDLRGTNSSEGVWAPCLSWCDGVFYLVYTIMRHWSYNGPRDMHNYLVTSKNIAGDWSEPIYLNSSGFDPSLFHDTDGRKWLVNMQWDYRQGHTSFAGIVMQEYSEQEKKLTGSVKLIFKGTKLGWVEGPHLYKKDGWYYLLTAEGGTKFPHAVTMARSKVLEGPYEVHPENPILTSYRNPFLKLQKAGHGCLVEAKSGEWYLAHLCARPLPSRGRCILGRETAIQKVTWQENGWIAPVNGNGEPAEFTEAPEVEEQVWEPVPEREDFNNTELPLYFQSLRVPLTADMMSLTERPGFLRLKGGESIGSRYYQSLIARRQQAFCYTASTALEFDADSFLQLAGLIVMYDIRNFFYMHITKDEERGKVLNIQICEKGIYREPLKEPVLIEGYNRCYLKAEVRYHRLRFFWGVEENEWNEIGDVYDVSVLSDDYMEPTQFTGAFVGLCCQDLSGNRKAADFDYFDYREEEEHEFI